MRTWSIAFLFAASAACAENWQPVATLDANGAVLLIDTSDIMEVKGYRRAWFKSAYETDQPIPSEYRESVPRAKKYRWVRSANLFHCTEKTIALAELRWFSSDGEDLGSRRAEALSFRKVSPGSVDEQMLEAVCSSETVRSRERLEEQAQMTRPAHPKDYYPEGSIRRGEQGTPTVQACVDSTGKLLREPVVAISSGFQELDGAAIQVAKDSRYRPGTRNGTALPESCIEMPITFRTQTTFPDSPRVEAKMARPANPDDYYPPEARGRREQGSPVVQACVGRNGKLLRDPVITDSSGFPSLDAAAIEVARASRYAPGRLDGIAAPESCIKYKVRFAL
jgi:TonB family protein